MFWCAFGDTGWEPCFEQGDRGGGGVGTGVDGKDVCRNVLSRGCQKGGGL